MKNKELVQLLNEVQEILKDQAFSGFGTIVTNLMLLLEMRKLNNTMERLTAATLKKNSPAARRKTKRDEGAHTEDSLAGRV